MAHDLRMLLRVAALGVERSFAWIGRFRRLARDDERLASTLRGLHVRLRWFSVDRAFR